MEEPVVEEPVVAEPLPPGMAEDEMQAVMAEAQGIGPATAAPVTDELLDEDPGTPLENETQHDGGDAVGEGADGVGGERTEATDLGEADAEAQDDDDDDDDDDVEITIGAINSQPTFRPGPGRGGAVGAKPTSKLDIDATAQLNGQPIFDVDLGTLEDKPWRKPGADLTDYFNYGFTEEAWLIYCERQKKLRTEFGSAAQANKVYFSQPPVIIGGQLTASHQQAPLPVPTLEQSKMIPRTATTQPTQIINLVPPSQRQENQQQILRTVVHVPTVVKPVAPAAPTPPKPATVLTPAVPTPAEQVPSMFDSAAALYDSEPSSPGTPPPRPGSTEHEDSNPPSNVQRSAAPPPAMPATPMTTASAPTSTSELSKITSTVPPTSANFSVPNLSVPPPRVLPPTNLPPPGVPRFGPPPIFTSIPPPGFGNPPPTSVPPPGFGNPPPPGMPPHHFSPGPYGFPPPMRPQMPPPRFAPPPGTFGGFDQQPNMPRADVHSPASYSDRSSDSDDRGDRYEARFPPGSGPSAGPPGTRPRIEHRRSRSPHSSGRRSKYSHGHSGSRSGHRSRSPMDRDSDKERDRGSSRRGRDDDDSSKKKSRSRRDDTSSSDKKKSSSKSSRDDGRSSSSSKRKRSKERKGDDEKSSRH